MKLFIEIAKMISIWITTKYLKLNLWQNVLKTKKKTIKNAYTSRNTLVKIKTIQLRNRIKIYLLCIEHCALLHETQ